MCWVFETLGSGPGRFQRTRQFRQRALAARQAQQHGGLGFGVRGDVVRARGLCGRRWHVLGLVEAPSQHGRQDFHRVEQGFLPRLALGEGVREVHELHQVTAVGLSLNGGGVSDIHGSTSLQSHTGLALQGSKQAGTDVSGAMHWHGHGAPLLDKNVVAAVEAVYRPARGL